MSRFVRKLFCVGLLAVICSMAFSRPASAAGTTFQNAYATAAVRLLRETMKMTGADHNVLISPDSILSAVAMVENGASGQTRSEMEKALGGLPVLKYTEALYALHGRISKDKRITYNTANALWYKKGKLVLKSTYRKRMAKYFEAQIQAAPFDDSTVKEINSWVTEKTSGKITKIIDRLDPEARIAVLNAVYFKGNWFEPYGTVKKRTFTSADGTRKKVRTIEGTESEYVSLKGAEGFVKPYQGGTAAFLALLPPKGTPVSDFLKSITGKSLASAYKKRQKQNIVVETRIPEFEYEYSVTLNKPLRKLGIRRAFSDLADFSAMTGTPVCIDTVQHKTYIKLDRNGTEAAAVTAILMKANSVLNRPEPVRKKVYLNRPFVYAIVDTQTGLPLFLGVVNEIP